MTKLELIYSHAYSFFHDRAVWFGAIATSISLSEIDLILKAVIGLPGAVYVCFKIYKEFIQPLLFPKKKGGNNETNT